MVCGYLPLQNQTVVAAFYILLLGFVIYRSLTLKIVYQILVDACEASAFVMLIVASAGLFPGLGRGRQPRRTCWFLIGVYDNQWVLLFMINALIFVGKCLWIQFRFTIFLYQCPCRSCPILITIRFGSGWWWPSISPSDSLHLQYRLISTWLFNIQI